MTFRRSSLTLVALIATMIPAQADNAGSYLAARSAMISSDYDEASQYYARALQRDPLNPQLLENATNAFVGLGNVERAAVFAERLLATGEASQIAGLTLIGEYARNGEWDAALDGVNLSLIHI